MSSWAEVEACECVFASKVRDIFAIWKHATMASTSADGSPRISGTGVEFAEDGYIYFECDGWRPPGR